MSLVGPRPELPFVVEKYKPWQHARLSVRPGLTGLWQVERRGQGPMADFVHLDLEYIRRASLFSDVRILLRTMVAVCRRTGQ
jgi:lipopolysaccharide/colanic/teichoic acid biosynthesis glycosyltransferase